jgi:hypothetical protein
VAVGPGNFYVGITQTNSTNANISFDTETPMRTGSFFQGANPPVSWSDLAPATSFKVNIGLTFSAPTAATVTVSGRVLSSGGTGVRGAIVTMNDMHGIQRSAITNAFGYYVFDGVQSGETFVMRASARRYTFSAKTVNVTDSLTDIDFTDGQ